MTDKNRRRLKKFLKDHKEKIKKEHAKGGAVLKKEDLSTAAYLAKKLAKKYKKAYKKDERAVDKKYLELYFTADRKSLDNAYSECDYMHKHYRNELNKQGEYGLAT